MTMDITKTEQKRFLLVHEYMVDAEEFALALNQAHVVVTLLVATYNAINLFAHSRVSAPAWPNLLPVEGA